MYAIRSYYDVIIGQPGLRDRQDDRVLHDKMAAQAIGEVAQRGGLVVFGSSLVIVHLREHGPQARAQLAQRLMLDLQPLERWPDVVFRGAPDQQHALQLVILVMDQEPDLVIESYNFV